MGVSARRGHEGKRDQRGKKTHFENEPFLAFSSVPDVEEFGCVHGNSSGPCV